MHSSRLTNLILSYLPHHFLFFKAGLNIQPWFFYKLDKHFTNKLYIASALYNSLFLEKDYCSKAASLKLILKLFVMTSDVAQLEEYFHTIPRGGGGPPHKTQEWLWCRFLVLPLGEVGVEGSEV